MAEEVGFEELYRTHYARVFGLCRRRSLTPTRPPHRREAGPQRSQAGRLAPPAGDEPPAPHAT